MNSNEKPKEPDTFLIDVAEQQFNIAMQSENIDFYDLQLIKEKFLELKHQQEHSEKLPG